MKGRPIQLENGAGLDCRRFVEAGASKNKLTDFEHCIMVSAFVDITNLIKSG
jgi:hypothetical protein